MERDYIPYTKTKAHRVISATIKAIAQVIWWPFVVNAVIRPPDPYWYIVNMLVIALAVICLLLLAVEFYGYVFWKPKRNG